MSKTNLAIAVGSCAFGIVLLALPGILTVPYFLHLTILSLILVIVAQGQNLVQGYTGYVSIAQGGFMGIGAYCSALLSVKSGLPVWVSLPLAPVVCSVLALAVGYPTLRVKGHYFAIVTLAYNMVIFIVLLNFTSLTGGEAGIPNIPPMETLRLPWGEFSFNSRSGYYYLVLFVAAGVTLFCALVVHSRIGRVMVAIRQNEALAEAVGVATWRFKLFSFVASASLAGLAGALYAHFTRFINPTPFGVDQSLNAILAVILGGSGTLAGPVVGAFAVIFLPEYLRIAETYRLIAYGLILVLTTIFMPRGIVRVVSQIARWRPKVPTGK